MLIFILIHVFTFEKGSNGQNHSTLDFLQQNFPFLPHSHTPWRYLENPKGVDIEHWAKTGLKYFTWQYKRTWKKSTHYTIKIRYYSLGTKILKKHTVL